MTTHEFGIPFLIFLLVWFAAILFYEQWSWWFFSKITELAEFLEKLKKGRKSDRKQQE